MKKILALVSLISVSALAQGTIQFQTMLDSSQAIPPNSNLRIGNGEFTLTVDGLFSGTVNIFSFPVDHIVEIFRSTSPDALGTGLYAFTPGLIVYPDYAIGEFGGQQHFFARMLTPSEINDVLAGNSRI